MPIIPGVLGSAVIAQAQPPPLGYIDIPATSSNNLRQTPDDAPAMAGQVVFYTRMTLNAVPGSGSRTICERWTTMTIGVNRFILRFDATAKPSLLFAQGGGTQTRTSTQAWPFAAGVWAWLRTTFIPDNGASQHIVKFETSPTSAVWTVLDTVTTGGVASIDGGSGYLAVGGRLGSALGLNGKLSDLLITASGATVFEFHAETDLQGTPVNAAQIFTSSGTFADVNRSGSPALVLVPPS